MNAKSILILLVFCLALGAAACAAQPAKAAPQEEVEAKPVSSTASERPETDLSTELSGANSSVTKIERCLQQAITQVYTGQPTPSDDVLAAVANYLEEHPELCEAYLPFDDFGVSVYVLDEASGYQLVLFRKNAFQAAHLQYRPEQGVCEVVPATPVKAVECAPEVNALVEDAQTGASYEFIYYDLCSTDTERTAFEEHIHAAKNAIKIHLTENWSEYAAEQPETLRAMLSFAVDYAVIFELYDGDTVVVTLHYLPGIGVFFTDKLTALESFTATERIPTLPELQDDAKAAEDLLLLDAQQYGSITASYYVAAQELDVWSARRALFGSVASEKPAQMDVPAYLGFVPFRAISNPSASSLLICNYDASVEDAVPTYYLYDGETLSRLATLNARPFGTISPAHVRWRSDDELVYDVENPKTGAYTTYLYQIQSRKETVLLADYAPFPFYAEDTTGERYLLVADTYALRIERGGEVFLRQLPDGDEIAVAGLQTPETAYFHMTPLSWNTVVYFSADENGHFTTLAFLDCESGNCAKLERPASDALSEQFIMLLDENTIAIPATTRAATAEQTYLFVYSFNT